MSKITCCKGCTKRSIGCHAACEDYKQQKQEGDAFDEQVRKAKYNENITRDYVITRNAAQKDAKIKKGKFK